MGVHKLTAGDGYQYLTRQVAAADEQLGRTPLGDYYTEKGEAPGVWLGAALGGLAGVESGDQVSAEQMQALFGAGRHPNADAIESDVIRSVVAAGGTSEKAQREADKASRLGAAFRVSEAAPRDFIVECAREYEAFNRALGNPATARIPAEERARIRSSVGRRLFAQAHQRAPLDARELSGFIARESRPREQACAGYDLTFSPVKSVSTLWAVADLATAREIQAAHDAAVRDTLAWLERDVISTRRGARGARSVDVTGLLATAFTHRDARSGDPDLHTHVAVANKVQDPVDGKWLSIDGQGLFKHTVAASERYNTRLEVELNRRLGLEFEDRAATRAGARTVREVSGVSPELMTRWSQRRTAITARTSELSEEFQRTYGRVPTSKEALDLAQQATLETREGKQGHRSWADQREVWRAQAVELLGSSDDLDAMTAAALNPRRVGAESTGLRLTSAEVAERALAVIEDERAVFQAAHVRAEVERITRRCDVDPDQVDVFVEDAMAAVWGHRDVSALRSGDRVAEPAQFLRRDGSSQYARPQLFTTSRIQSAEKYLLDTSLAVGGRAASEVDVAVGLLQLATVGIELNAGQRRLVHSMATSGRVLQLALAPAGTGKTTAMKALSGAWRSSGGEVFALAPTAVAAAELAEATGGEADTLAKLVWHLNAGDVEDTKFASIGDGSMLLVDEAGMAGTPELASIVAFAKNRGAVVRLVGDDQQLAAIGAGGVLRDIASHAGTETLADAVRFNVPGEAAAGLALREGRTEEALGFYLDQSRVRAVSPTTATDDVFEAWAEATSQGRTALMMAADNDAVNELNGRAREHRLANSTDPRPTSSAVLRSGLEASVGDTIVTRRNDRNLALTQTDFVKNGDRWTVLAAHNDGALTVRHDTLGRTRVLPANYVAEHVDLGYATTVYGAQGQTVERAFALITDRWDRSAAYVALTRGTHENVAFVPTGGDGDPHAILTPEQIEQPTSVEVLARVLARDGHNDSALTAQQHAESPTQRLEHATRVYVDARTRAVELIAGPDQVNALAERADTLFPDLSNERSWPQLAAELMIQATDPSAAGDLLQELWNRGEVQRDEARDVAAVLLSRIDHSRTGAGPHPWLPQIPTLVEEHPTYGPWLNQWAQALRDADTETRAAAQEWTLDTAPAWALPYLDDPALVADLAVWRAAQQVADDDLTPAGPRPSDRRASHAHQHLTGRAERSTPHRRALNDFWTDVLAEHPEVTSDPWWPVLAQRLDELTIDGIDPDSPAVAELVDQLAPEPDVSSRNMSAAQARIVEMHRLADDFFRSHRDSSWVPQYLESRGFESIVDRTGYAPKASRGLTIHLRGRGYSEAELLAAGLAVEGKNGHLIDRFRDRLMLPITVPGPEGPEPVAFVGRAPEGSTAPKYLNTATTSVYTKGNVLYGLAEHLEALRNGATPVLVEGQLDAEAITLAGRGDYIGLSTGGTALTAEHLNRLAGVADLNTVIVATDTDDAGQAAAASAWNTLAAAGAPKAQRIALDHKDPAHVLKEEGPDALRNALENRQPLAAAAIDAKLNHWHRLIEDNTFAQIDFLHAVARDYKQCDPTDQAWISAYLIVNTPIDTDLIHDVLDTTTPATPGDQTPAEPAETPDPTPAASDDTDDTLRDTRVVLAALDNALDTSPLPDTHAAAALWSRLVPLTKAGNPRGNNPTPSATRQLLDADVLDERAIATIMATTYWTHIEAATTEHDHPALTVLVQRIAEEDVTFTSPEHYAETLLDGLRSRSDDRLSTTGSAASRRRQLRARLDALRETRRQTQQAREEARRHQQGPGPAASQRN